MDLIRNNLKRVREAKTIERKNQLESDILHNIIGMVSVWADSEGLHKGRYALEILSRIEKLNADFREHEEIKMSPAEKKYRGKL